MIVRIRPTINSGTAIAAYRLADGRQMWIRSLGRSADLQAVTVSGDRAVALTRSSLQEKLASYQLHDGTEHDLGTVPLSLLTPDIELYAQGGAYVIVTDRGTSYPPVAVVR